MWYTKIMKNKTLMYGIILAIIFNLLFFVSLILCLVFSFKTPYFSIFITFLIFAYHIDIRLIFAEFVILVFKRNLNLHSKIFKVSDKDFKFLSKLKVKKWKDKFVAWDKSQFVITDLRDKSKVEFALRNNITAEIIHWACFFVGLFAILIGCLISPDEWWIYVVTAVLTSFLADFPPILIQRFNRYRLQRLI